MTVYDIFVTLSNMKGPPELDPSPIALKFCTSISLFIRFLSMSNFSYSVVDKNGDFDPKLFRSAKTLQGD